MRQIKLVLAVAAISGFVSGQTSPKINGKLDRIKLHGVALEGNLEGDSPDRDVSIYLPPSYQANRTRRYPVLYILHGFADGDDRWFGLIPSFVNLPAVMEAALDKGMTHEMILVMPKCQYPLRREPLRQLGHHRRLGNLCHSRTRLIYRQSLPHARGSRQPGPRRTFHGRIRRHTPGDETPGGVFQRVCNECLLRGSE